jgi:hypothetical protein
MANAARVTPAMTSAGIRVRSIGSTPFRSGIGGIALRFSIE